MNSFQFISHIFLLLLLIAAGSVGPFTGAAAAFANGSVYTNTGKGSTWEGGIRMPAFAYWPGTIEAHSHSNEIISTMDILPSLMKLAGCVLHKHCI